MLRIALVIAVASLTNVRAAEDAGDIVRKSVELDQANWLRMQDYTWMARSTERHFDSGGKVKSTEGSAWETVMLDGEPYRRMLERNGRPLPPSEQKKQQDANGHGANIIQHFQKRAGSRSSGRGRTPVSLQEEEDSSGLNCHSPHREVLAPRPLPRSRHVVQHDKSRRGQHAFGMRPWRTTLFTVSDGVTASKLSMWCANAGFRTLFNPLDHH